MSSVSAACRLAPEDGEARAKREASPDTETAKVFAFLHAAREGRYRPGSPPPPDDPRLSINGVPMCHAGNLTVVLSGPKRSKTQFIGAAVSALLGAPEGTDLLGWESPSSDDGIVIYVDTEQSKRQHWEAMQRVYRRCGESPAIERLESYHVTGQLPMMILQLLKEAVACFGDEPGDIKAIVIDGIADLVESPNDEAECFRLVRELMQLAEKSHAPIITVLHVNPSDHKARGHLGSQIERKAETVLELLDNTLDARRLKDAGKQGNGKVITAITRHARHAPLTLENAPRFGWDEEAGMPMSVSSESASGQPNRDKATALEVFSDGEKVFPGELKQRIADKRGVGLEMAKKILSGWVKAKLVEKVGQHYQLTAEVTGNAGNGSGNLRVIEGDGVTGNAPPYKGGSLPNYPLPHPDDEDPNDPWAGF